MLGVQPAKNLRQCLPHFAAHNTTQPVNGRQPCALCLPQFQSCRTATGLLPQPPAAAAIAMKCWTFLLFFVPCYMISSLVAPALLGPRPHLCILSLGPHGENCWCPPPGRPPPGPVSVLLLAFLPLFRSRRTICLNLLKLFLFQTLCDERQVLCIPPTDHCS